MIIMVAVPDIIFTSIENHNSFTVLLTSVVQICSAPATVSYSTAKLILSYRIAGHIIIAFHFHFKQLAS